MSTVSSIDIGLDTFWIYGDLDDAESYANGRFGASYTAWRAASDDDKARTLVMAADILDAESWEGAKSEDDQVREWPRSGVTDVNGDDVDEDTVPDAIAEAEFELAVLLYSQPSATDQGARQVKRVTAKGVTVEFTGPAIQKGSLPLRIRTMIAQYLETSSIGVAEVSGTTDADGNDLESQFSERDPFSRDEAL